jgi:hypothetical protein
MVTVAWTCACGTKVRAVIEIDDANVKVQCPYPSCSRMRTLPGHITDLWIAAEIETVGWQKVGVNWLMYPDRQSAAERETSTPLGILVGQS